MGYGRTRDVSRMFVEKLLAQGIPLSELMKMCDQPVLIEQLANFIRGLGSVECSNLLEEISHEALSVRTYNCLRREGYGWIVSLCLCTEEELLDIRNFGERSLEEVEAYLKSSGSKLRLRMTGETCKARLEGLFGDTRSAPVESLPVLHAHISEFTIRVLKETKIATLGQLEQVPEERLRRLFTPEDIATLREGLKTVGLTFHFAA